MDAYLRLKSRALQVVPYSTVDIGQYIPAFTPDEARIQKDILRQRNRHGKKAACDSVAAGDMVVLSCKSENPKFCKSGISISVGKGLFHRELEEKLIGLAVGVETKLQLSEAVVSVCVEKAVRTVLPELTDEEVASWGMEDVASVADLRRFCIARQIGDLILECEEADEAAAYIWQQVSNASRIVLDAQEEEAVLEEGKQRMAEMDFEDDPAQTEIVQRIFITGLRAAAIGQAWAESTGELKTRADYESYLRRHMEADPTLTPQTAEERHPLMDYLIDCYGDVFAQTIDRYVAECWGKVLNP